MNTIYVYNIWYSDPVNYVNYAKQNRKQKSKPHADEQNGYHIKEKTVKTKFKK